MKSDSAGARANMGGGGCAQPRTRALRTGAHPTHTSLPSSS